MSASFWGYSFKMYQPLLQSRLEKRFNHYNQEEYLCFYASNEETSVIVNEAISATAFTSRRQEQHPNAECGAAIQTVAENPCDL